MPTKFLRVFLAGLLVGRGVNLAKARVKVKTSREELPSHFFSTFKKEVDILANRVTRKAADRTVEVAKEILENQSFKWQALDPDYLKWKQEQGLDERILIATRDYIDNGIGQWEENRRIFVGPLPGIHKPSGLTYVALSRIHEFGTWSIPARPLWRPLLVIMLKENQGLREEYNKGLRRAFSRQLRKKKRTVKR